MFIMVIYSLLMAAFVIYRVILPLKIRKVWKVLLSAAAVMACCKNQITHLLGGPMFFAPDLPGWFLLPAAWIYAAAFLLFFGLVFLEIARLAAFKLSDAEIASRMHMSLSGVQQAIRIIKQKSNLERNEFAAIL